MKLLRRLWAWVLGLFSKPERISRSNDKPPPVAGRHWWNTPKRGRARLYKWANRPAPSGHIMSKRERAKRRGWLRRNSGLTRSDMGAIGAGHMVAPVGYEEAKAWLGL